jgi:hypothetical protein
MIKIITFILILLPSIASSATDKELAYLEMLNYRLNMMAVSNEMADSLAIIADELKRIRCKTPPIESDCNEIDEIPEEGR